MFLEILGWKQVFLPNYELHRGFVIDFGGTTAPSITAQLLLTCTSTVLPITKSVGINNRIAHFHLCLARTVEYNILGSDPQRESVESLCDGCALAAEPLLLRSLYYAPVRYEKHFYSKIRSMVLRRDQPNIEPICGLNH